MKSLSSLIEKKVTNDELRKNLSHAPDLYARTKIHALTGGHCPIYGGSMCLKETPAIHVNTQSTGGTGDLINFLPFFAECNS